jgi:hypothetical protein
MQQRLGGAILAVIAVVFGIYSGVDSWPWWLTGLFSLLSLSGVALMLLPVDKETSEVAERPTAFIKKDASGSSLDTIYSDADFMVDGNARETRFRNIIHRTDRSGG